MQLERRVADQQEVLEAAKHYVKPGGRLVYVTCSLFASENNRQVSRFLSENPDYAALPMADLWSGITDQAQPYYPDFGAVFSPLSTDTDGFYIAVLQHKSL